MSLSLDPHRNQARKYFSCLLTVQDNALISLFQVEHFEDLVLRSQEIRGRLQEQIFNVERLKRG